MVLAVRAVAMAARVGDKAVMFTLSAFGQHQGTTGSTADLHGIEGIKLGRENRVSILFEKLCPKNSDD